MKAATLVIIFTLIYVGSVHSQSNIGARIRIVDSSTVQIITTKDGSTINGRIIEVGENEIKFEATIGTVQIPIDKIKDIKEISTKSIRSGEYWFPNPHATRLYLGPTAFTLKQGEGYFQSTYIFFAGVGYGLTDNISFAGGASLFPGAEEQLFYVAPKLGLEVNPNFHFALGATFMNLTGGNSDPFGSIYAVGTLGSRDNNFSVGINKGFGEGEFKGEPVMVLGYQGRMSRRVSFVSENWYLPQTKEGIISFGVRFFNESMAADLGFWRPTDSGIEGFPFIPYVDFVVMF